MIIEITFEDEQAAADAFAFILHGRFDINLQAYERGLRLFGDKETLESYLLIIKHIKHKKMVIEDE